MKNTVNLYVKTAFALIYFSVIIRHVKGGIVQDLSLLDAKDRVLTENGKELLPQSMESPTSQNKEQAYPPIMKLNQSLDCQLSYLPSDDGKCLVVCVCIDIDAEHIILIFHIHVTYYFIYYY